MTAGWTSSDLGKIASQVEIRISSERPGGGFNRWTPIWVVRVGNDLYVRSGFGKTGAGIAVPSGPRPTSWPPEQTTR